MVQLNLLVVFIGVIFSMFLLGSYWTYHRFYDRLNPLRHWTVTGLASAKRVSLESSELLSALQASYKLSLENFKDGINSSDHIDQRNVLLENFAIKLATNLQVTLEQGLSFNDASGKSDKKKYEDYSYTLIHSDYIPEAVEPASKEYNSTLITEDKIASAIDIENIAKVNDSGKISINEKLLKTLVGDEASALIKANPDYFGTIISEDGLDLDALPNGLRLKLRFDKDLDEKKIELAEKQIISTGQIRILSSNISSEPIVPSPEPVIIIPSPPLPSPPPPTPKPEPIIQEIEFSLIPADKRAIVYDPSKPIDQNNPIRVINTKEGGYSILFVGSDGYINIGIGDSKTSSVNAVKGIVTPQTTFSSATLTLVGENENISLANNSGYSIKMDTIPRGRKRYTSVDQSFVINGMTIPKGFIVVASKQEGTGGRPGVDKFEDFRVYDPESGALVTYFGQAALKEAHGAKGEYFDFEKFYTAPGTKHMGAELYEFFSVVQLFPGKLPSKANQLWVNIQGDLERDTKLSINSAKEPWQERILKDLNDEEMVYLGHELRYETTSRIREIFGFQSVAYKDDNARKLDDAMFSALLDYAKAKVEYWDKEKGTTYTPTSLNDLKVVRERAKQNYEQTRLEYNNYIKYNILPDWLKPVQTVTNTNQKTDNPKADDSKTNENKSGNPSKDTDKHDSKKNDDKKNDNKKNDNKNENGKKKKITLSRGVLS